MEMNKSDTPHWAAMSTPRCGADTQLCTAHTHTPRGVSVVILGSKRKKFGYMYVFSYYYKAPSKSFWYGAPFRKEPTQHQRRLCGVGVGVVKWLTVPGDG